MWLQSNAIRPPLSSVFMKKSLSIFSALTLALPIAALAQGTVKIGTVDMQKAFKDYNKTKEAEVKINDAKNAAKKEYDDRAEAYKKALDEINNLNKQLESTALSADKKTGMAKDRDDKIANIKSMEREISDFRQTRERQLQEQLMRMREGIVKEITDVVMEKVKAKSLDFVLDKSGISINGVPVVMYAPDNVDFTSEIIDTLNKPGRATASAASNKRPAAGASVTPARAVKP
jgi:outer membrane protein